MIDLKENLAENLGAFLMEFRDDVIRGLEEYLQTNNMLLFEKI